MTTFYDPYGMLKLMSKQAADENAQAPQDLQGIGLCFASLKQGIRQVQVLFQNLRAKQGKHADPKDP